MDEATFSTLPRVELPGAQLDKIRASRIGPFSTLPRVELPGAPDQYPTSGRTALSLVEGV